VGVSRDCPIFFRVPPIISGVGEAIRISNLTSTFRGSIRTKAHEKLWRKGSVGVSRDCPFFSGTPYYLRHGKSYGFQTWPVHSEGPSEQRPIEKFSRKGSVGVSRDCPFFGYPLLFHARVKLRTSNFACTFIGSIGTKAH